MTRKYLRFGLTPLLWCLKINAAHDIYFLGVTPTPVGANAYSARLFGADQTTHKLRPLKEVSTSTDGVAFVRSAQGVLVLGTPHLNPNHLAILSLTEAHIEMHSVRLPTPVFVRDSAIGVTGGRAVEMFAVGHTTSGGKVINVELKPRSGVPHVIQGQVSALSNLQIEGETGGPSGNWDGFITELALDGNIRNQLWSALPAIFAPGPPYLAPLQKPVLMSVLCANSRFLVVMVSRTHNEVEAASEITYFVYSQATRKWTRLVSPGGHSRLRLFDHWLVALIVEAKPSGSSGSVGPQAVASNAGGGPDIDMMYADLDPPVVFTGRQVIIDLDDNSRTELSTGSSDSEVLSISDHWLWFREESKIFLARLAAKAISDRTLVVDDVRARQIHWTLQR